MNSSSSIPSVVDPSRFQGEEVVRDAESFDSIIDNKLYLGNLSAAESSQSMMRLGITHILSVCPDHLATSPTVKHFTLPMRDDEHFDILEHLPITCQFIQDALDAGGKVFVHCVMGISRSATVVCAYLMFSRRLSASQAIRVVRTRRPRSRPNYNFIRQLQVFFESNCDPSPSAPLYIAWRKRQEFDETHSLRVIDGLTIIPNRLFLSFDFPTNKDHASTFLDYLGVTHVVSITPDQISSVDNIFVDRVHKHFIVAQTSKESLLISLPLLCQFIIGALQNSNSRVFLHCMDEIRGGIAICAYLMASRQLNPSQALEILQDCVPLFDATDLVNRHLELFQQCHYAPLSGHPLVRAWVSTPSPVAQSSTPSYLGGIIQTGKSLQTSIKSYFGS
ncbi:protein-tyrosine phosphatase-like protein [Mycena crocata]|nr:protein-tyrosine phosphatase-like protein [Mycena crocata]